MGQESPGAGFLLSYLGSCDLQTAYLSCVTLNLSWLAKG